MSKEPLPSITAGGFGGVAAYIALRLAGQNANPELLLDGLPQGRLASAQIIRAADEAPHVAVVIADPRTGQQRAPRLFDPDAFAAVRLLLLPGAAIRIDGNQRATDEQRALDYLFVHEIGAGRIVAGASVDQGVRFGPDHHDHRRSALRLGPSLPGPSTKPVRRGRADAIQAALDSFDRATAAGRLAHLPAITRDEYRALLGVAFSLTDALPLAPKVGRM